MGFQIRSYQKYLFSLIALLSGLALSLCLVRYAAAFPDTPAAANAWVQLPAPTAPGGTVQDLAVAQAAPQTIYALLQGPPAPRLFRSQDAALSWTQRYTFTQQVDNIALDPADPASIYAGGQAGLFHSPDSGLSWTQVYTLGQVVEVVSSTLIYVGGQAAASPGCIYGEPLIAHSSDGGNSWQPNSLGCQGELRAITVHPTNPGQLYAATNLDSKLQQIWHSGDSGQTWQALLPAYFMYGQIFSLVIDPGMPQNIYYSSQQGIGSSLDGGQTWEKITLAGSPHILAFNNGNLYAIPAWSSRSVYVYRSDDGGQTWWQNLNKLPNGVNVLIAGSAQPEILYAGLQYYGIWRSQSSGGIWQETDQGISSPAALSDISVDPIQPGWLYAGASMGRGGLFVSSDDGLSWTPVLTDTKVWSVAVHPVEPISIYAGGEQGLYRFKAGQSSQIFHNCIVWDIALSHHSPPWLLVSGFSSSAEAYFVARYHPAPDSSYWVWTFSYFPSNGGAVFTAASDPTTPDTLYAGGAVGGDGTIWRSFDGGTTWQIIFQIPYSTVWVLLTDPFRPGRIIAAADNGPYFSQDGGATWALHANGLPPDGLELYDLLQDDLGGLYGNAGYEGIYRWSPTQALWEPLGPGEVYLGSLAFQSQPSRALLTNSASNLMMMNLPPVQRFWLPVIQR